MILYQKNTGKLEPRWSPPFRIDGFATERGVSYKLRNVNGRLIKGSYHRNHLKRFVSRSGHLAGPTDIALPPHQTIRKPARRAKFYLGRRLPPKAGFWLVLNRF